MQEYLDVLTDKGAFTGKKELREICHREGLWHQTVHVWLKVQDFILLQKRSERQETFPCYWDISCAGHITAGERKINAVLRELVEEVNLRILENHPKFLTTLKSEKWLSETFIDKEFCHIYLVELDDRFDVKGLKTEEVSEFKWEHINNFKLLMNDPCSKLVPHEEEYQFILQSFKK